MSHVRDSVQGIIGPLRDSDFFFPSKRNKCPLKESDIFSFAYLRN